MFRFEREQRVCTVGGIKIGGQPGDNPPLLIGNMFQKGDILLANRKEGDFNRSEAEKRIREMEQLSLETGIPALIALVATSAEEMKTYIDFLVSVTTMPFAIDIWMQQVRLAAARYVAEKGLQDRLLYNSITPWDENIPAQVAEMTEMGIKHVVVQVFDTEDKTASGRVKSLRTLLPLVEKGNFASILVDTAAMNLPALAFSLEANYLIKQEFGLPAGFAPSNGTYMWRKSASVKSKSAFPAIDAGTHAIATLCSDFLFYGPTTGSSRVFPAVAAASSIMATYSFGKSGKLPIASHPLAKLFPDSIAEFEKAKGDK